MPMAISATWRINSHILSCGTDSATPGHSQAQLGSPGREAVETHQEELCTLLRPPEIAGFNLWETVEND